MKAILKITSLAIASCLLLLSGCGDGEQAVERQRKPKKTSLIKEVKPSVAKTGRKAPKRKKLTKKQRKALKLKRMKARAEAVRRALETPPADLSSADKKIWLGLKKALDADNYAGVRDFAVAARNSPSAELRSSAVQALGWFGSKGLATLTGYLGDADETVAQDAQMAWESGLMEIDDDATKLRYLETAMMGIDDELMLDAISQNYNQIADEVAAVESIVRVAEGGGKGAEKAKEAYEFITGEDWTNSSDASAWVAEKRAEAAQEAAESEEGVEVPDALGGGQGAGE